MKNDILIENLTKISVLPIENIQLLKKYFKETEDKKLIFFDWECPPRFVDKNKNKEFINYLVDLKPIFKKKKIDQYTEIPRILNNRITKTSKLFRKNNLQFNFLIFIADLNAELLTPFSNKILGKNTIKKNFQNFKKLLEQQTEQYYFPIEVIFFSDFLKSNRLYGTYKKVYQKILKNLIADSKIKKIWQEQIQRTEKHLGLTDKQQIKEIAQKTIASYAAEGLIFELLEKKSKNFVWFNTSETDNRTIIITNLLRKEKMPMIFPK